MSDQVEAILYTIILILFVLIVLAGCSTIPSMRYCDKVSYDRDGTKVVIHAECTAPIGGI